MTDPWDRLVAAVQAALGDLQRGEFLLVEFVEVDGVPAWSPWPYAQGAPAGDGWYCEAVSAAHLPPAQWPLDELALRRSGWHAPAGADGNWYRQEGDADDAARFMVGALRDSRDCQDPSRFRWQVLTLPTGPGSGTPSLVRVAPLRLAA